MALETLENVIIINGRKISHDGSGDADREFIWVDHLANEIAFRIQKGPCREVGMNGVQVMDMVAVATEIIKKLDTKFPCTENKMTIKLLEMALQSDDDRTERRTREGTEGRSVEKAKGNTSDDLA